MAITAAKAFALQAKADFAAYEYLLQNAHLPECHWLHFLQMACEKLAKAHLMAAGGDFESVSQGHKAFSPQVRAIYRGYASRHKSKVPRDRSDEIKRMASLARDIEILQPSIDRLNRPDNCEYPWEDSGTQFVAPAEYKFDIARRLRDEPTGRAFLTFVSVSISDLINDLDI